jgi:hypothetical protein
VGVGARARLAHLHHSGILESCSIWVHVTIPLLFSMFYSAAVFAALLVGGNAFSMPKAPQRMTGLKMAEAWFPDAATSNTVGMDTLA